jgi:preprotein translocase subunit SecF
LGTWTYASHLELRSDFLELLPRDSPGFKAFEHQLGRTGGNASLIVVVESPDRQANERFIDALTTPLQAIVDDHRTCSTACAPGDGACRQKCGPELISYLETGTKEVRRFFAANKWLYADLDDLQHADQTLDHQIAIRSGLVSDLDAPVPSRPAAPVKTAQGGATAAEAHPTAASEKQPALGLDDYYGRWKARASRHDDFPTGYFATPEGTMLALRIISPGTGMGERGGDLLLARVKQIVAKLSPASFQPDMKVGYAGDIPNAIEEKDSLVSDAAWATGFAFVLILGGIVFFFRSPWSLPVIAVPAFIGVGCAYSFAMLTYGYVNTSGAFLGAIILGNGINYPIVLLARYREFRARGQTPDQARRGAVWNAFRAELVGALVGSIAYGSLVITRFRGFNQFGMIGFVGMLLVWGSMIPCVPALIVVFERIQESLPVWLRDPPPTVAKDGSHGPITRLIAIVTERVPWVFLTLAAAITIALTWKLPAYLRDPWEYDFHNLGSRGSQVTGAAAWSNKADRVFGGKMNVAGAQMLGDTPEQVPLLKAQIIANDAADPKGTLIADVATIDDLLPGAAAEQKQKLEVLAQIRDRLTPAVLASLEPGERARVEEMRPPEDLHVLAGKDVPSLLRRRFQENDGTVGTVFYVKYRNDISLSDGRNLLRIAKSTDNVKLADGTIVQTASRSTIFAEMIRSMERDGPLATFASFAGVVVVVAIATGSLRGFFAVILALVMGVLWTVGGAAWGPMKLNFLNFIALPITFGIGSEYPFNVFDRARILHGDVSAAVRRTGGAVALCSYTTTIGYGSLLFADNQALQSFGKLAMSGEIACLVGALFVLPALLHVMRRPGDDGPRSSERIRRGDADLAPRSPVEGPS